MKKGTTIIEILVAISIFVVAFVIIGALFVSHTKLFKMQESVVSLKLYKSLFAKNFRETAEAAKSISATYSFGGIPYTSSSSTVIFQVPSIDATDEIIPGAYDYVVFYHEGENLFMQTAPSLSSQRKNLKQKIGDSLENMIFRYNSTSPTGASLINAFLRLNNGGVIDEITVSVLLRNVEL